MLSDMQIIFNGAIEKIQQALALKRDFQNIPKKVMWFLMSCYLTLKLVGPTKPKSGWRVVHLWCVATWDLSIKLNPGSGSPSCPQAG